MFYYYLVIALQLYCFYHVYKTGRPFYWYLLIFFLPLIGCVIYLITQVLNKRDAQSIQSNVTDIINPTRKIKGLQNRLEFSDSFENRINLADAYFESGDFQNAISQYEITLQDKVQNDLYARQQLIACFIQVQDYDAVIKHSEYLLDNPEFYGTLSEFYYGFALYKEGRIDEAEEYLASIDKPYSNYEARLELAKFYLETDQESKGKELLLEISAEADYMTKPNRKLYRATIQEVERLVKSLDE